MTPPVFRGSAYKIRIIGRIIAYCLKFVQFRLFQRDHRHAGVALTIGAEPIGFDARVRF